MVKQIKFTLILSALLWLTACGGGGGDAPQPTPGTSSEATPEVEVITVSDEACPPAITEALEAANGVCTNLGRNQACYGNELVNASLRDNTLSFAQPGDIVDVTAVDRLSLEPFAANSEAWGVVIAQVQANIPDSIPGQNVTIILFGDVEFAATGDANTQAYTFSSGIGAPVCREAPNGMVIRTPEGVAETVSLTINGVDISLGSTAYMTAEAGDEFHIALLEGSAQVTSQGVTQTLAPNEQTGVPMDQSLAPAGPPEEPEPFEPGAMVLPMTLAEAQTATVAALPTGTAITSTSSGGSLEDESACAITARSAIQGEPGTTGEFACPAGCDVRGTSVWGTDIYTDDSSICRAAIHAGLITGTEGGILLVTILEGQSEYQASERNGIRTSPWGSWGRSFSLSRP